MNAGRKGSGGKLGGRGLIRTPIDPVGEKNKMASQQNLTLEKSGEGRRARGRTLRRKQVTSKKSSDESKKKQTSSGLKRRKAL